LDTGKITAWAVTRPKKGTGERIIFASTVRRTRHEAISAMNTHLGRPEDLALWREQMDRLGYRADRVTILLGE
jgi:hypothetical protein